ncbi:MAG: response regulator transcription factor [Anaerolineales bacterium]|jgi:DNA-binding NarL/FixJ family response regulator
MNEVIRVVVVDDHALFRAGLTSLLSDLPGIKIVGEAGNGIEALKVVERTQPDVVLLDVNMPGMDGVETVRKLCKNKGLRIIMLTISKHHDDLIGAIQAGADGYLLKNAEPDELYNALKLVVSGKSILSPEVTGQVFQMINVLGDRGSTTDSILTQREMEVLECLSDGMTTAEIAEALVISENTVKTHVRHVLEKFGASNRAEAVSKALQMGLIGTDL